MTPAEESLAASEGAEGAILPRNSQAPGPFG